MITRMNHAVSSSSIPEIVQRHTHPSPHSTLVEGLSDDAPD